MIVIVIVTVSVTLAVSVNAFVNWVAGVVRVVMALLLVAIAMRTMARVVLVRPVVLVDVFVVSGMVRTVPVFFRLVLAT